VALIVARITSQRSLKTVGAFMGRIRSVTTWDGGVSWSGLQVVSPSGKTGYANGPGIYDRNRDQIVLQYQYIPLSSTAPMLNVSYFQVISRDDSKTWMNSVDITEQLRGCNLDSGNMQAQSAGKQSADW